MDLARIKPYDVFVADPKTNPAHKQKREYVVAAVNADAVVFVVLNADGSQIVKPVGRNATEPFVVSVDKAFVRDKYQCVVAADPAQSTPGRGFVSRRWGHPPVTLPDYLRQPAPLFD